MLVLEQIIEICEQITMHFPQDREMKNHVDFSPLCKNINLDPAHHVKQAICIDKK